VGSISEQLLHVLGPDVLLSRVGVEEELQRDRFPSVSTELQRGLLAVLGPGRRLLDRVALGIELDREPFLGVLVDDD
jgi:hypothetical protein